MLWLLVVVVVVVVVVVAAGGVDVELLSESRCTKLSQRDRAISSENTCCLFERWSLNAVDTPGSGATPTPRQPSTSHRCRLVGWLMRIA